MKCIGITKSLILQSQYLAIFLTAQALIDLQIKAMFLSKIKIEIKKGLFVFTFSFAASEN